MNTMKISAMMVAAAVAGAAFAAQNDALVSFSTPGVDTYADGSPVLDGECYALVWTATGSTGFSLAADGTASGGEIVLVAPVAKGGRCPKVIFEVDASDIETKYRGGSWGVYLLDTRRWGSDGAAKPAGTVGGKVRLVNAAGAVSGAAVNVASGSLSSAVGSTGAVASSATAVPAAAEAKKPVITGIRVDGANMYVTVKGTVPYLQYGLSSGATPDAVAEGVGSPRTGAVADDEEIVLVAPAKKGSAFFKVGRK